jgi:hypothetical protein
MKPTEILTAILKLPVNEANALVKEAYACLALKARNAVHAGQKVQFRSKYGPLITGRVTRVNRKNVLIASKQDRYGKDGGGVVTWTVSPAMLTVVEDL